MNAKYFILVCIFISKIDYHCCNPLALKDDIRESVGKSIFRSSISKRQIPPGFPGYTTTFPTDLTFYNYCDCVCDTTSSSPDNLECCNCLMERCYCPPLYPDPAYAVVDGIGTCAWCRGCPCGLVYSPSIKLHTCAACNCPCGTEFDDRGMHWCVACVRRCFPASARLTLENGDSVTMSELQIGDLVQTVSSDGGVVYSEIKTFLKKQHHVTSNNNLITTKTNDTISLTGNHLIFARNSSMDKFNPIYVDQVSIGDELLVQEKNILRPAQVTNVSKVTLQGAYVPITMEGNIIVDGVVASCYPSVDHDLAHLTMAPICWFPETIEWIFGNDNAFQIYVKVAEEFGSWILPYGKKLQ